MPDIQAVLAANEKLSQEVLRASGDLIVDGAMLHLIKMWPEAPSVTSGLMWPSEFSKS